MPAGNGLYLLTKQNWLAGTSGYDLDQTNTTDNPWCALVRTTTAYTVNLTTHDMRDDLGANTAGTDQTITSPTVALGLFDGGDLTYTAVTAGAAIEALVIYRHNSGATSTQPLVAYIDTSVTGLPVTPNGGNITVTWNASGIFQL